MLEFWRRSEISTLLDIFLVVFLTYKSVHRIVCIHSSGHLYPPLCLCTNEKLSLCKSAVCCYFVFAFCYPPPKKENASMACLLSTSKRPFQVTLHIRILDSWTKPVPFSFSLCHSFQLATQILSHSVPVSSEQTQR